jgi:hypothetical protein
MRSHCLVLLSLVAAWTAFGAVPDGEHTTLFLVVGTGGESQYDEAFARWASNWQKAGVAAGARVTTIGLAPSPVRDLEQLHAALQSEPVDGSAPVWLVLLGHGTFDRNDAKFNLRGDDLPVSALAKWIEPIHRPVVVIAAFSSSGAFLNPLAAPGRIVLTATRSGAENNFARFGKYLSETVSDPKADLDHDGQTSLLEAWISAAQNVADFYKSEGRLASEHSMLDDNGDGHGTPADWFKGIHVVKKASDATLPDGLRAHQIHLLPGAADRALPAAVRAERDALELQLAALRETKGTLPEDEYYAKIEAVLLHLSRLYQQKKP